MTPEQPSLPGIPPAPAAPCPALTLGIDPGITGAMAIFCGTELLRVYDLPTAPRSRGKGMQIQAALLAGLVRSGASYRCAYLERVQAMPPLRGKGGERVLAGTTSSFNFGHSFGVIEGVLAALEVPVELVEPARWKRAAGLVGRDKDAARTAALALYPSAAPWLARKKDVGRADAILIGAYGLGLVGTML